VRGVPRCSACGQPPSTPAEHLDLATVGLVPGSGAGDAPVARRFCRGCAPAGSVAEIVCVRCGDGPLVAGVLIVMDRQSAAMVDAWLSGQGWRLAGPVCPSCLDELAR
jgi:hypothetical protein